MREILITHLLRRLPTLTTPIQNCHSNPTKTHTISTHPFTSNTLNFSTPPITYTAQPTQPAPRQTKRYLYQPQRLTTILNLITGPSSRRFNGRRALASWPLAEKFFCFFPFFLRFFFAISKGIFS